jgi:type IV secretion system protein VirB9
VKPLLIITLASIAASASASAEGKPALAGASGAQFAVKMRAARASTPLALVAKANKAALIEPAGAGYVNAAQVYPWEEGRLYRLYTAPGTVSDIALQPGEGLISIAAGDTLRWVIGNTTSGSGLSRQTHILVKPGSAELRTNLVITTDRRVYLVDVESTTGAAMAAISWSYAGDSLLLLDQPETQVSKDPVAGGLPLESLNFDYSIEGDRPSWRPVRAFDDGQQVFIQFPPSLATGEAPPLFVIGSSGKPELVNYRLRGRYYVVDQLFSLAELRLGERRQQVVRIIRSDPASRQKVPS